MCRSVAEMNGGNVSEPERDGNNRKKVIKKKCIRLCNKGMYSFSFTRLPNTKNPLDSVVTLTF